MNFKLTKTTCYLGSFVQSIVNNLMPLFFVIFRETFGVSYSEISFLVVINFLTQLIVDALSVKFIAHLNERMVVSLAQGLNALGLIILGVLPLFDALSFGMLVLSTVIMAIGSGLCEVLISPILDRIPGLRSGAEMSLLHAFYPIGHVSVIIVSVVFFALFGKEHWFILPLIWAVVPIIETVMFLSCPFPEGIKEAERTPIKSLFFNKEYLVFIVLMLASGASEITVSQFASLFAEESLGLSKTLGDILGPCLFALCMVIGRLFYGFFGDKIPLKKSLLFLSVMATIAYLLISLSPFAWLSFMGLALAGISVSIMWPGVISLCAQKFTGGGTPMFALLALAGDLGCAAGPLLAGVMSDLFIATGSEIMEPLSFGILIATIFPLVSALVLLRKEK